MNPRFRASTVVIGAVAAAVLAVAPAHAVPLVPGTPGGDCVAGYMSDPNSAICWQMAGAGAPTVGGGPCMPGRVGTCLGYLANNPMRPGDTLPDQNTWP